MTHDAMAVNAINRRERVRSYYRDAFRIHGTSPRGVDWNSEASQTTRFRQLARIIPVTEAPRVLDYGCGYGAFLPYLRDTYPNASYIGFDIVPEMLNAARAINMHDPLALFIDSTIGIADMAVDVAVLNGVFHVRQEEPVLSWEAYARDSLQQVWRMTSVGIAFNVLSAYSDTDRRRPHLYYGAPEDWLQWCVATFGRHVSLLHDYGLYEFTVLVGRHHTG